MEIIGLIGQQGVGKNYIAENILFNFLKNEPTIILAFADHFKIDTIGKYNLDYDKVFIEKNYETRKKLQTIGTEEGRNKYGEDIWIKIMYNWIKVLNSRGIKRFIITDVRFQNEADWIKSLNGILIKIEAPERFMKRVISEAGNNKNKINEIISHPSEKNIKNINNYDICIKNDPKDDLDKEVIKIYPLLKEYS